MGFFDTETCPLFLMWVELKVKLAKHIGEVVIQNHLVHRLLYGFHLHKKPEAFSGS